MTTWVDAKDSGDLFELLCSQGGLMPDSYDASLASELATALHLASSTNLALALRRAQTPMEDFVKAFFAGAAPFVMMWADLLTMFERAGAHASTNNLRIEYDFGADQPKLTFDLDSFRQTFAIAERLMSPVWFGTGSAANDLWDITYRLRDLTDSTIGYSDPTNDPAVDDFVQACHEGDWPAALPARPDAPDSRLAQLLEEIWVIADVFLRGLREISTSHLELMQSQPGDAIVIAGLPGDELRQIESDFWLPTLIATAVVVARESSPDQEADAVGNLAEVLRQLRNTDPTRTSPGQRLEDFLGLPLWKHRYEVFSNWVCTLVLDALDDQRPRIHSADGKIEFSFAGTHLATFDGFEPRLHLWTELRSPLANPTPGSGRKANIQPDMSLMADPITARVVPLAIECKQYQRANNRKFADALTDYLRGLPNADVLLVDYGTVREDVVLQLIPADICERARVITDLQPCRPDARADFRAAIRARLGLEDETSGTLGSIELTWASRSHDLDLHVTVPGTNGDIEVSYNNRGAAESEPFCTLEEDITNGGTPERITVHQWLPGRYEVRVNQYTPEGLVRQGEAQVIVQTPSDSRRFACPDLQYGQLWHVCDIDGDSGEILNLTAT